MPVTRAQLHCLELDLKTLGWVPNPFYNQLGKKILCSELKSTLLFFVNLIETTRSTDNVIISVRFPFPME